MLEYKKLEWGNWFSYGDNNSIVLNDLPVLQLVGQNGFGKSSIALILEETLFNKNSKNIKKADILNREITDKHYWSKLTFSKDGIEYEINIRRGTKPQTVLLKDGVDISSHTATNTFKSIEKIVGYGHDVFSQIVYQSSGQSLRLLTATDTQRKAFLIELLQLTKYTEMASIVKFKTKEESSTLKALNESIEKEETFINKYEAEDLVPKKMLEEAFVDTSLQERIGALLKDISEISNINKARIKNNKYKEMLEEIKIPFAPNKQISDEKLVELRTGVSRKESQIFTNKKRIKELKETKTHCPTCGTKLKDVDDSHLKQHIEELEKDNTVLASELSSMKEDIKNADKINEEISEAIKAQEKWESIFSHIDKDMPEELLNQEDMEKEVKQLRTEYNKQKNENDKIIKKNEEIAKHNSRVETIKEMIGTRKQALVELKENYNKLSSRVNNLEVLSKAFSPTGLVAYKIENTVADLEDITNQYLTELSDGRFSLSFKLNSSDKLNVVVEDNGKDIDILAPSSGELTRINLAALLGIRNIMQTISNTKTNLLILDETISNLDKFGKERLIEMLVKEPDLNTILVSHDYAHPLMEKLSVIKENNISRVEWQ